MKLPRTGSQRVSVDVLEKRQLFAAGSMDPSFGASGMAVVDFGSGYVAHATASAVQSDGKTIVVGKATKGTGSSAKSYFAIARFTIDGKLDNSFGPNKNGRIIAGAGIENRAAATAVAVQPDGKIIVAGEGIFPNLILDDYKFAVMRLMPNGTYDQTFGTNGANEIGFAGSAHPTDIALQNDGKIIIAGYDYNFTNPHTDFAICRLNTNGKLDKTFDSDGKRSIEFGSGTSDVGSSVAIDYTGTSTSNPHYGKIVMSGTRYYGNNSVSRAALIRFKTNGFIDNSFDKDGKVVTSIPGNLGMTAYDLAFQPDGKIVIAGSGNGHFAMQRITPAGAADNTFGSDGNSFVITPFGSPSAADRIWRNGDGSLIVAGRVNGQFAVAKYSENGILDNSFGDGGKVQSAFGSETNDYGIGLAYGPGKRFTIAGGLGFGTARYMDTGAGVVTVGMFQPNAYEAGQKTTGFIVGRPERLPYATRVYFSISGTATSPDTVKGSPDYTAAGLSLKGTRGTAHYVNIPANQTFALVTITPKDDAIVEGTETAVFSILPGIGYEPDIHKSVTVYINDNDGTTLHATADTYVRDGTNAATNYGAAADLSVKKASNGFNRQIYMKFHIDSVSTITTAKLRLFGRLSALEGAGIATSVFGSPTTNWSESGLNFNNKPATTGSALATTTISDTTARWYEWDITAYLKAQKAAGKTVVTLILSNPINSSQFATFNSREAGNGPQILVG